MTIRKRITDALTGNPVTKPAYLVYDWFIEHIDIDWQSLFDQGLGKLNHATIVEFERPNVEIIETKSNQDGKVRTDIKWITDKGQLHEWFLDGWRQEYLVKSPEDYKIIARAFSGTKFIATDKYFDESEKQIGDNGITVGQIGPLGRGRTPFQTVQIDFAGLERFSIDIATQTPELLDLLEIMNDLMVDAMKATLKSKATQIKLWENLSVDTMGPNLYKKHLIPVYEKIFDTIKGSDKKIQVHYDGKLKVISDYIADIPFDGIDSLTPSPEGDMEISDARQKWSDKFFWLHPSLSWFQKSNQELEKNIIQIIKEAGPKRFCLMISEDVPPDWKQKVPFVLNILENL
ncbi:MAG TPA: uroporphyrinogen decarboxylase family protein [Sedimentisphaerales bacterium]|nr:uroporphyrinogen decarboxylase family protein [Sedimentisphaerales bacterium]